MPKDPTPRLNLKNPATGEFDWDKPWWENTKVLDDHPGIKVVTTETLPLEPWPGQVVFNTDDLSLLIWEGSNWLNFSANYLFLKAESDIAKGNLVYINSNGKIENLAKYPESIEEFTRIIGFAVQNHAEGAGFSVVREMVGHGLGAHMHESPEVPNYGKRGKGPKLKPGLVICIEPMINLGTKNIKQDPDGWTIRTMDSQPSAHYELALAIRNGEADILSTFEYIENQSIIEN